jgi:CubicO group peptidase (beta-lactamase class C family)
MDQKLADDPRVTSALEQLRIWVETEVAYEGLPGVSMGVVYDQDLIWSQGFGYANPEKKIPASPSTIYSICSISKLFTSLSVMQLRDQGKLRLDDPVRKHLPWFDIQDKYPEAPEVTIEGILTHSAGLPREADFPYWSDPVPSFPTRDQIMDRVSEQEELYPAFTYYQYSNLGLTLAGEVVAAASGQPYAEYVQQHILDPLGLEDTSPELPNDKRGEQFAIGFTRRFRDGSRKEVAPYLVRGIAPAAGFASTVEDLAQFASWQFRLLEKGGNEILSSNTLKEMQRVHWVDPDWRATRGLGFSVSHRDDQTFVGHGGSCPGYRTQLAMLPSEKIAVIFMTNGQGTDTGFYTAEAFKIVTPAITEALESPGKGKQPNQDLEIYVGRYDRPRGGETHVFIKNGELAVLSAPTKSPADSLTTLKKVGEHTFRRIRDDGELGEAFIFEVDQSGEVTRLIRNSNYSVRQR